MIVLFNKPYGVLSQFTDRDGRATLADYIAIAGVYAAGRLDRDSEGLLVLTDEPGRQHRLAHPRAGSRKTYWVQVEREPDAAALQRLRRGVDLNDGPARALEVKLIDQPQGLWPRTPPVRVRKSIPTAWLSLVLGEGRNRQVRRMTAAVGHPTLRLVRARVGEFALGDLQPGQWRDAGA